MTVTETIKISETSDGPTEFPACELAGTEKQVDFARRVRRDEIEGLIQSLNANLRQKARNNPDTSADKAAWRERAGALARSRILALATDVASAAWWLDNRGSLFAGDYLKAAAAETKDA